LRRVLIPLVVAAMAGCASARQLATGIFGTEADRWASEVVIHRDAWGTPHVLGRTDAAVMFGAAFAQAEDRYPELEEAVLRALGRTAEVHGPAVLAHDAVRRAFQVERLARAEYDREPDERRVLWNAWAAGLNHFLSVHPEVPGHVERFEPWWVFALSRPGDADMVVDGVRLGDVLTTASGGAEMAQARDAIERRGEAQEAQEAQELDPAAWNLLPGASAWAVAPARTADGRTLLAARGAVGAFAREQRWEVHLLSEEGWHFAGVSVAGAPLPHSGHNEHLGWVHTAGSADAADAFEVRFEDPDEPLHYRWEDGWRRAEAWEDTVWVAGPAGPQAQVLRFTRTHHGPVIRLDGDGRGVAVRLPRHEEGGALQQRLAMQRATDVNAFWQAHGAMAIAGMGTVYADSAGNLLHVPAGAVPRRDPAFDRGRPADGADPATAWDGYHAIDEVPYLFQPRAGWLRGGGSPFAATAVAGGPDAAAYPVYMDVAGDQARAAWSRQVLGADTTWTAAMLGAAVFAGRVRVDQALVAALVDEWERAGVVDHLRVEALDEPLATLRAWDGSLHGESVAATHWILLGEALRAGIGAEADYPHLAALEAVLAELREGWGTAAVPWGQVNRLRPPAPATVEAPPDFPAPGAPAWTGAAFVFEAARPPGERRRVGQAGHSWVGITAFGPAGVEAHTVLPFGQSGLPASPHAYDQAALYAEQGFKPRPFSREAVRAAAVESYAPGARGAGGTGDAGETRSGNDT